MAAQQASPPRAREQPRAAAAVSVGSPKKSYIVGLDGIRAAAVVAVILYHAGLSWMPGGLLGVDVFFVVSGFLITSLLLQERQRSGRISLREFWTRRLRRLAPALLLMVLLVTVVWGFILKTDPLTLRRDSLFALGYGANWWFAFSGQGYFQSLAPPSPLLHTWSLAVEEQFYLLWPLVVVALCAKGRGVGRWALVGALIATLSTLAQSLAGVWTDRLYYGTDTRAIPLLIGAACGAWYASHRAARLSMPKQVGLQTAGLVAAAAIGYAFCAVAGTSEVLYRGGFLLIAVAVAVLILAVTMGQRGPLALLLDLPALRYLGRRSYGLYLWHWPLFLLLNHARTGLSGSYLLCARLVLTLGVAAASYRWVETPIRQGTFRLSQVRGALPAALALVLCVILITPQATAATADLPQAAQTVPSNARVGSPQSRLAGAGTSRVLFVGDSIALTLANALSLGEAPYKVHIDNVGLVGCGVSRDDQKFEGQVTPPPSAECLDWPDVRRQQVRQDQPDLVALLVGRWETTDQLRNGQWLHIGDPALDAYLSAELDQAIDVLSSTGATVALLTMPCLKAAESANGQPYPEDDPARVARFNQLLTAAQRRHPTQSRVVDLNAVVCPGGNYTQTLQGVTIRTTDGVHFPLAQITPVADRLLPQLRQLAVASASRHRLPG